MNPARNRHVLPGRGVRRINARIEGAGVGTGAAEVIQACRVVSILPSWWSARCTPNTAAPCAPTRTRLLGDPVAAEDIVQEALVRLWRNPQVLHNGKGSVRGWLLTVVRNLVTDRIRARAARPPRSPRPPAVVRCKAITPTSSARR